MFTGPHIVTDGLVLHLDAANTKSIVSGSTTWTDRSGYGNNGTLINGPGFNTANGGSVVFDGVNDYVNSTLSKTPNNTTIQLWYKWNGINQFAIVSYIGLGNWNNPGIGLMIYSGTNSTGNKMGIVTGDIVFNTTGNLITLSANIWIQATLTRSQNLTSLYYNGQLIGTANTTPNSADTVLPVKPIGSSIYSPGGNFANIQVYNRALTASEVLQNYNATKSRFNL